MSRLVLLELLILFAAGCVTTKPAQIIESDLIRNKTLQVLIPEDRSLREARDIAIQNTLWELCNRNNITISGSVISKFETENDSIVTDIVRKYTSFRRNGYIKDYRLSKEQKLVKNNNFFVKFEIEAVIGYPKGEIDPNFNLEINQTYLELMSGENLELKVKPSIDCYLTCVYIYEKGVQIFYPNRDLEISNFFEKGKWKAIPSFELNLNSELSEESGIVRIIATKKNIDFSFSTVRDEENFTYNESMASFIDKILKINQNDITEKEIPIILKGKGY